MIYGEPILRLTLPLPSPGAFGSSSSALAEAFHATRAVPAEQKLQKGHGFVGWGTLTRSFSLW